MKIQTTQKAFSKKYGFTLIEMIGVLAVIAILAAVLVPKVFQAINDSRVNNAAMACQTAKTALTDHYAKFGGLTINGTLANPAPVTIPAGGAYNNFDTILLQEQFLDKPFTTKLGTPNNGTKTGARVDLMDLTGVTAATAVDGTSATFDLDNSSANGGPNDVIGSAVAVAVIPGVALSDARDLSLRIDGESLSTAAGTPTDPDFKGRVKYGPANANGQTEVYIYLTHR